MKIKLSRKNLCIPYAVFLIFFVIIPLILMVYYAFTDNSGRFSTEGFSSLFQSTAKINIISQSLLISILTTIFSLFLAYPVAYVLARSKFKKKSVLLMLFVMPMWINYVLRINALREFLSLVGLLGETNFLNTLIGMVYDFFPFMVLPLYTTLIKLDNSLIEASKDLGASPFTTFRKVTIPLSLPGIISGITMVFMPSMTNYVISESLGNGKITIIGKMIEDNFGVSWQQGSAIALFLLVIIFVSMLFTGRFSDTEEENAGGRLW